MSIWSKTLTWDLIAVYVSDLTKLQLSLHESSLSCTTIRTSVMELMCFQSSDMQASGSYHGIQTTAAHVCHHLTACASCLDRLCLLAWLLP